MTDAEALWLATPVAVVIWGKILLAIAALDQHRAAKAGEVGE